MLEWSKRVRVVKTSDDQTSTVTHLQIYKHWFVRTSVGHRISNAFCVEITSKWGLFDLIAVNLTNKTLYKMKRQGRILH